MIDIKLLRSNPEPIRASIVARNLGIDLDTFIKLDLERLALRQSLEALQTERNRVSKEIPTLTDAALRTQKIAQMKGVGEQISEFEAQIATTQEAYDLTLASLPNLLDPTAAVGPDESGNVVEATVGEKPVFTFTPRTHYEIGEARGWIDIAKGAEVSGARFWYLKGDLVLLQFAVMNYVISQMVARGFEPVIPPFLVREPAMYGTGFFPADRAQIYEVNPGEDNLFLIGTSEVPLTSYHTREIMDLSKGAVKYVGYSPCFRREAGTYGKDMKGILRGHQFDKIEMVCFSTPEGSPALHAEMVALEEHIWSSLGIPYQRLNICSGDLGNPAMKKIDLEAWMPGQSAYREVTSCSNI